MQMVHVEGNDVKPYFVDNFKIAPGETYDVLVKIKKNAPYIIYAESIDTQGSAIGALVTRLDQVIDYQQVSPFPEPLPVMREMMSLMMQGSMSMDMNASSDSMAMMKMDSGMKMNENMPMKHSMDMRMPTEPTIIDDTISSFPSMQKNIGSKYQDLTAAVITNDPNKPVNGVIKMELFGYMDRFILACQNILLAPSC